MESKEREAQYYVDTAVAFAERTVRRLWIALILTIVLLVGTNAAWIWYEAQWEDVSVSQEVDTGNGAAFVTGVGDLHYGENQADG